MYVDTKTESTRRPTENTNGHVVMRSLLWGEQIGSVSQLEGVQQSADSAAKPILPEVGTQHNAVG